MFLSDFLLVVVVGGGGGHFWAVVQTEWGVVLHIDIFWRGDICNMSYLAKNHCTI